jgi:hypothetical protein
VQAQSTSLESLLSTVNAWRKQHGAGPLRWSASLAAAAASYAAAATSWKHSDNSGAAECISTARAGDAVGGSLMAFRQMTDGEVAAAKRAGRTPFGPCQRGAPGRCGGWGWGDENAHGMHGHYCILGDACATEIGIGAAPARWQAGLLFVVWRVK